MEACEIWVEMDHTMKVESYGKEEQGGCGVLLDQCCAAGRMVEASVLTAKVPREAASSEA